MIHKKCDIANFTLVFAFAQNNDDKRNRSHFSFLCFRNVAFQTACCINMHYREQWKWMKVNLTPSICFDQIETSTSPPPPPWANPGILLWSVQGGVGNLTCEAFPGVGIWLLPGCGGKKLNRKCQVSIIFFSVAEVANSYERVFRRDGIN